LHLIKCISRSVFDNALIDLFRTSKTNTNQSKFEIIVGSRDQEKLIFP